MQYLKIVSLTGLVLCAILGIQVTTQTVQAAPKSPAAKAEEAGKITTSKKIALCEKFFGAALYNGYLERVCGFDGQVKNRLSSMMDSAHCLSVLPKSRRDKLATEVLDDAEMRLKAYGENSFCEGNIKDYTNLMDMLPEATGDSEELPPDSNSQL